jgi:hypothetical protein
MNISSFIVYIPCGYKWVNIKGNKITQGLNISKFKRKLFLQFSLQT